MSEKFIRVLLVDDEESLRRPLSEFLETHDCQVDGAADVAQALDLLTQREGHYDVALIDEVLQEGPTGLELLREIKSKYPDIETLLFTGWGMKSGEAALRAGAYGYLAKPFNPEELAITIRFAAERGQARRERRIFQAFQQVTTAINRTLKLDEILNQTCKAAVELLDVDHSGLVLFDNELTQGRTIAEFPNQETPGITRTLGTVIPLGNSPAEQALVSYQRILNIADVANEVALGPVRGILSNLGIQSILIVPVVLQGRVIASFSLDGMREPRVFTQNEIELCKGLANHAAIAIENARLLSEAREGRDYLEALFHAGNAILFPDDPKQVLQNIVEMVCQATGAWRAVVLTIDRKHRKTMRMLAQTGFQANTEPSDFVRGDGISVKVITSREPYFISDVGHERQEIAPNRHLIERGTKAAACLPLFLYGDRTGALWIEFLEPHSFSDTEKQALQLYATQSAIAYDNARRIQELEQLRLAADAMATAAHPKDVLQRIVESARRVLEADYAVIWSYDAVRKIFFPEELAAANIPTEWLDKFQQAEPESGKTTQHVLNEGYVAIEELASFRGTFLGKSTRQLLDSLGVESFQGIRLEIGGEWLGVLFVDYTKPHSFDTEDQRILDHFANHAALTLKKARLLDQVTRSRESARVVASVSKLGKLTDTLSAIVKGARHALRCDIATLYTFDEERERFVLASGVGMLKQAHMRPPQQIQKDSALWNVVEMADKYYHAADQAQDDSLLKGYFVREEKIRSALGIQLRYGVRRVGVMFINYRTAHRFTEDEIQDARLFADQAAVAIRNAELLTETENRADTLQALYDAGKAITETLTLDQTLARIAKSVFKVTSHHVRDKGKFSHIALLEGRKYRFLAASNPRVFKDLKQSIDEIDLDTSPKTGIVGRVIETGLPQRIGHVEKDPDYLPCRNNIHSQLSVPMVVDSQVIGVISIEHPVPDAFTSEDERNVGLLAQQAVVAVMNAQDYGRTQRMLAARTALAWAGMASSTWRHSTANHAITIREQVQLLRHDLTDLETMPGVEKRLEMIERLASQILEKPLTVPLTTEEGVVSIKLNELIRERTRRLFEREQYQSVILDLNLNLDDNATVRASPDWMRRALDVLIENAVEATLAVQPRKISITTQPNTGTAEILIADNGVGIPESIRPHVLYDPIKKPKGSKGQGMGLLLAQTIVQTYGGDLRVGATGSSGTTMIVSLPLEM